MAEFSHRHTGVLAATALGAGLVLSGVTVGACRDDKSAIMLAVTTDMKAPKDINAVSVTVSTNNTVKHNVVGRVTPQGDVLLPATLAIVEPDDPNATIRIRVMAFQERRARVLRDVRTSIPNGGRVALLRIPLNFVNDGSTQGELPDGVLPTPNPGTGSSTSSGGSSSGSTSSSGDGGSSGGTSNGGTSNGGLGGPSLSGDLFDPFMFVPNCPNPEHTWIDGECKDAYVDPATLPDYNEADVGRGDQPGVCFDVKKCFANASAIGESGAPGKQDSTGGGGSSGSVGDADAGARKQDLGLRAITLDRTSCNIQLNGADATSLNLALVTPDTGECIRPGDCYVPLDSGPGGWKAEAGQVKLPSFVCKLLTGKNLRLHHTLGCAAKKESNPICVDKAVEQVDSGGGGPIVVGGAKLVVPEEFASSVARYGSEYYLAGSTRLAHVTAEFVATAVPGFASAKLPWLFGFSPFSEGTNGILLTNGTSTASVAYTDAVEQIAFPAGANLAGSTTNGQTFFFAATGSAGGIYSRTSGQSPDAPLKLNLPPQPINDATVILSTVTGFLYGTSTGHVIACDAINGSCGIDNPIGQGRVDAFAVKPDDQTVGYAILGDGVYRSKVVNVQTGSITAIHLGNVPTSGAQIEGQYYPHAIGSDGTCVYYTATDGVHWTTDDGTATGLLFSATADKPALGLVVSPSNIYFTLFAPAAQGGGLYEVAKPPRCTGGGTGGNTDGGDGALCFAEGADCAGPDQCCSKSCVAGRCGPPP